MIKYQHAAVDGLKIFYREAGSKTAPAILLLHGFPTSSHMFRNLIPVLADRYHVVAPDLPGFGFSGAPDRKQFRYTFERLARVIGSFAETIGLDRFAVYVFDYGAPVGLRLALAHPERITAIISQNGNPMKRDLAMAGVRSRNIGRSRRQRIVQPCASSSSPKQLNGNILTVCRIRRSWRRKPTSSTRRYWPGLATTKFSSTSSWITPATSSSIPSSKNISAQSGRHCLQSGERMIRSFCLQAPKHSSATTRRPKCVSSTPGTSRWRRMLRRSEVQLTIS